MKPKKAKVCVWKVDSSGSYSFITSCGWLTVEHKYDFCPFCGGKIREGK